MSKNLFVLNNKSIFVKHCKYQARSKYVLVMLYTCSVVPCDRGGNKWLCTTQQADPSTGAEAAGRQLSYPSPKAVNALRWSLPSRVTLTRCISICSSILLCASHAHKP